MEIKPKKHGKIPKMRQVVWLDYKTNNRLFEHAAEYNVAPNVLAAEILTKVLGGESSFFQQKPEKETMKTQFVCPYCWYLFDDLEQLKKHIAAKHKGEKLEFP